MLPDVEIDTVLSRNKTANVRASSLKVNKGWDMERVFLDLIGFMILALWGGRGEGDQPGGTRDW